MANQGTPTDGVNGSHNWYQQCGLVPKDMMMDPTEIPKWESIVKANRAADRRAIAVWFCWIGGVCLFFVLACFVISRAFADEPSKPLSVAAPLPLKPCTCTYPLRIGAVHDGDTLIKTTVELGYGVELANQSIRLAGFDAWEISRARKAVGEITDAELAKGKIAKAALEKLIAESEAAYLQPDPAMDREAHGRLWGRLVLKQRGVDGLLDVAAEMKARGHDRNASKP